MAKGKRYQTEIGKRKLKIKTKKKLLISFFILLLIVSLTILVMRLNNKNKNPLIESIANDNSIIEANKETERMKKLKELQKSNSDIVAWIEIEGSKINYPVLQGTDNDFYMTHTHEKKYSKDGSLFLDKDYDWNKPSENLLIYGHNNIGSTEMFVDLIQYKEEEFYKTHKTIRFTTNQEDAEYEIIAVFLSRVYYKSEKDVFRYYYFVDAENEQEFNEYVQNSKEASLYNIDATAEYGDQLLTLSTCSYHTEDGRFAVVARKKK